MAVFHSTAISIISFRVVHFKAPAEGFPMTCDALISNAILKEMVLMLKAQRVCRSHSGIKYGSCISKPLHRG